MATDLPAQVRAIPKKPGVYLFRNLRAEVLYVGKAADLRTRVRSYFGSPRSLTGKTRALIGHVHDIEYVTTPTEQEALHLEATLVKKHQPFYNVRLKDDKHYPYLKIDINEPWPRVYITRRIEKDGARYFGPYASAKSIRTTLDLVKKLFPWRSCTKVITGTDPRPCLDFYINRCIAPCTSFCTSDEYRAVIDQAIMFLEGRTEMVLRDLREQMTMAAERLEFERAALLRDQLKAVQGVTEAQITATTEESTIDAFGLAQDGAEAVAQAFFVRGGKMTGGDHFLLAGAQGEQPAVILNSFLKQFYESAATVPEFLLLPHEVEEQSLLAKWLTAKCGRTVTVRVPLRGDKKRLVDMANENAREALQMTRVKWMSDAGNTTAALEELQEALHLGKAPKRIECYDISNIQGKSAVGSMAVFLNGKPAPQQYRRFRIKTVEGPNDFASLAEVLGRRFKRLADIRKADRARSNADLSNSRQVSTATSGEGWGSPPNLVIVDGGKGQLSAAHDTLRNLGLDDIPLAGLAKREEELFVIDTKEPIRLDRRSQGLYLIQRIRDEAHRFAITYHRALRKKHGMQSALDKVPGIGPSRKKALLRKFGNLKAVREASIEELEATPGLTRQLAVAVKDHL